MLLLADLKGGLLCDDKSALCRSHKMSQVFEIEISNITIEVIFGVINQIDDKFQ